MDLCYFLKYNIFIIIKYKYQFYYCKGHLRLMHQDSHCCNHRHFLHRYIFYDRDIKIDDFQLNTFLAQLVEYLK